MCVASGYSDSSEKDAFNKKMLKGAKMDEIALDRYYSSGSKLFDKKTVVSCLQKNFVILIRNAVAFLKNYF